MRPVRACCLSGAGKEAVVETAAAKAVTVVVHCLTEFGNTVTVVQILFLLGFLSSAAKLGRRRDNSLLLRPPPAPPRGRSEFLTEEEAARRDHCFGRPIFFFFYMVKKHPTCCLSPKAGREQEWLVRP